jgi:hypothetical protein
MFRAVARWALLMGPALGCDPRLPEAPGGASGQGGGEAGVQVTLEPPSPLDAAPRALRVRVAVAGQALDPGLVALVHGPVGPGQLREVAQQKVSMALAARVVPALTWSEDGAVVLAPTTALEAGEKYTLAVGELLEVVAITAATADPVPLLPRVWPPQEGGAGAFAVWCGDARLPRFDAAASLSPGGLPGRILRGAVDAGAGERCLRFEPSRQGDGAYVAPPLATASADPSVRVLLDPGLIQGSGAPSAVVATACEADEIAFGPGCARLADDRLYGRSPAAPVLWAVAGAGADAVFAAGAGDPFVISGLPPSTDVTLDVAAVDARGTVLRMLLTATTLAPMPHLIINEVLANPLGPEPQQEWVEIVNDGPAPAALDGYVLADGGGETLLPPATLAPGAFALLVNEAFAAEDGSDAAPAPGTTILRVPHLGKNGLSNAGEALALRDGGGAVVSRFPASPKPKAGLSVARRFAAAPDGLPAAFALAAPTPGRTNAQ